MRDRRLWPAALLLCVLSAQTHLYASLWASEPTLWAQAVRVSPMKTRPTLNFGVALVSLGRFSQARLAFQRVLVLATHREIPAWERRDAINAAHANLKALDALEAQVR